MRLYLISYDIFEPKRLRAVAKIVEKYKLRGQKSSWESPLDYQRLKSLVKELKKILKKEDKINIIEIIKEPILLGKANSLEYKKDRNGGVYLSFEGRKKVWREFVDLIVVLNTKLGILHNNYTISPKNNPRIN